MTDERIALNGYARSLQPLTEGKVRKGGINPHETLLFQRPPPPAPMRPATPEATKTK